MFLVSKIKTRRGARIFIFLKIDKNCKISKASYLLIHEDSSLKNFQRRNKKKIFSNFLNFD